MVRRLVLVAIVAAAAAQASADRIRNLSASADQKAISVSFEYEGPFENDEISEAVRSGLPTIFTFDIELTLKRENWFDKTLDSARLEVIATFNSRTREYLVNYRRNRRLVRSENVAGFDTLVERMTKMVMEDVFTQPDDRYLSRLRVRVRGWNSHDSRPWFYAVRRGGTPWEIVPITREAEQ
ncbi:MAG: DUF4390 domain-containing protein [Acidobacteria bacterium]|nr:DUF4390 domain-containing protein [Acidobacteriota bacterium]